MIRTFILTSFCLAAFGLSMTASAGQTSAMLPHPESYDVPSLKAIFKDTHAPKAVLGEFADRCDEDFSEKDAAKLVKEDTERMHWCFYAKIYRLQESLQTDGRYKTREKKVKQAFQFLSPIAKAFAAIAHDSHYTTWEKHYYGKASEWAFVKKPANSRAPASVTSLPKLKLKLRHE